MSQAPAQEKVYTEEDYYNLPEDVRAELIDGRIYYQAAPNRKHQTVLSELHLTIGNYLKSKRGPCRVFPAPFAVKLFKDRKNIVEPDISVICDKEQAGRPGMQRRAGLGYRSDLTFRSAAGLWYQVIQIPHCRCSGILDRQSAKTHSNGL